MLPFATTRVVVKTPALEQWRGGVSADWSAATSREVYATVEALTPGQAKERHGIAVALREVMLPAGDPIAATDRLSLDDGRDWEILHEPMPITSPTGALSHVLVVCKRIGAGA
ncbi:MAG: hypothetical protein Q3999_05105 [Buchananella hordeovulneris]|nr:hypothetical protein [Buchananella hordeovulneris]